MLESQDIQSVVDEICNDFVENPDNWIDSQYEIQAKDGKFKGLCLSHGQSLDHWNYAESTVPVFDTKQTRQLKESYREMYRVLASNKRKELLEYLK